MALYDEAIIDAQKLREVAETAARNKILEAITPKIRAMINSRILAEQEAEESEEDDLSLTSPDEEVDEEVDDDFDASLSDDGFSALSGPEETFSPVGTTNLSPATTSGSSSNGKITINNTGDIHITESENENDLVLSDKMAESLAYMIRGGREKKIFEAKINSLNEKIKSFKTAFSKLNEKTLTRGQRQKVEDTYNKLISEVKLLRREVSTKHKGSQHLERKLTETIKEMKTMSSKTKKNIFAFLFEGEDSDKKLDKKVNDLDEADLTLGLSDEEEESLSGASDSEGINSALEAILANITGKVTNVSSDEDEDEDSEPAEDEEIDLGGGDDEDTGDLDLEEDDMSQFGEADEMPDETEFELDEADEDVMDEADEEVFEVSESALRKELSKMRAIRESNKKKKLVASHRTGKKTVREIADAKADQFGGGEVFGDTFEMSEEELLNVLVDELGSVTKKPTGPKGHSNESATVKKAMQEAAQYKKIAMGLKTQMNEMNLFNAKLLYANKLMQNKGLSLKQQKAIVEALDNAKTINEAKLLYKSLSESLAGRGQGGKLVSEGAYRSSGSSSRSTRSAQPVNSGVEVDRWATLAGIPSRKAQ